MGEMADYLIDQMWDWDGEGDEDDLASPIPKTCRMCDRSGLHWETRNDKWRLCDERGVHVCPVNPLREPAKDASKTVTNEWAPRPAGYKGLDSSGQP